LPPRGAARGRRPGRPLPPRPPGARLPRAGGARGGKHRARPGVGRGGAPDPCVRAPPADVVPAGPPHRLVRWGRKPGRRPARPPGTLVTLMHLRKYHGLGNDFLVLVDPDGKQPVDGAVARAVCDRHRGAGADGLIRVTGHGVQGTQPREPLTMELYNADGSRAETSGNGLRCLARAVVDAGIEDGPEVTVHTDAGRRRLALHDDGAVSVEMGTA